MLPIEKRMLPKVPGKYHTLAPFEALFQTGLPALMYHKIGRRPLGVKLKGLYVSTKRFTAQLEELKAAGFSTANMADAATTIPGQKKTIVLTFDDGFRDVFENAMTPMAAHGFNAIQFLVPNFIGRVNEWDIRDGEKPAALMDETQIRDWLRAGHDIGSHSMSHARLTRLSVRDAREEIFASKKKLEDTFARPIEHFCYPYGDWNESVRDLVMEAGYRTACTTKFGINTPETPALTLYRIAVRHPTRTLGALKARLFK